MKSKEDRLPRFMFALSLALLVFGCGVAVGTYEIFPHRMIHEAVKLTKSLVAQQWVSEVPVASNATILATFEGQGIGPVTLNADAKVGLFDTTIDNYVIQRAYLEVSKKASNVEVPWFGVRSPYANIAASGALREDATFEANLIAKSGSELPDQLKKVLKTNTKVDAQIAASGRLDYTKTGLGFVEQLSIDANWDIPLDAVRMRLFLRKRTPENGLIRHETEMWVSLRNDGSRTSSRPRRSISA